MDTVKKKKNILISVLICIAVLTASGAGYCYFCLHPFRAVNVGLEILAPTAADLAYYASVLRAHGSDDEYVDYRNEGFDFDLNAPQEYFVAVLSVEVRNTGPLTMEPKYLTLKKDNDIVGFSVSSLKYSSVLTGRTGRVVSRFICRRNGMTDAQLKEFLLGLDFCLVQEDNIFGETRSRVSLKDFASANDRGT